MHEPVWQEARRRALAETLELVRLNDPWKASLVIGVPLVAAAVSWYFLGQIAWTTLATLLAVGSFGLVIFGLKTLLTPAKMAQEWRQRYDETVAENRSTIIELTSEIEKLQMPTRQPDNYGTALFQNGRAVGNVIGEPLFASDMVTFPMVEGMSADLAKVFVFQDEILYQKDAESFSGTEPGGIHNVWRGLRAYRLGKMSTIIGRARVVLA